MTISNPMTRRRIAFSLESVAASLAISVALLFCIGLLGPVSADSGTYKDPASGMTYQYMSSQGACSITGYEEGTIPASGVVSIPAQINGDPVTQIWPYAISDAQSLTKVNIPASVNSFTSDSFNGCVNLAEINVDANNGTYQSSSGIVLAKDGTSLLMYPPAREGTSYTVPDGVTAIGTSAFMNAKKLQEVVLPDSVTKIGNMSFLECDGLTNIQFSSNLTEIGSSAFQACTALSSVDLPASLTKIGSSAFRGTGLKSVSIPAALSRVEMYAFYNCSALSEVTLQDGVQEIGDSAFSYTALKDVTLPDSVTKLEGSAFNSCRSLASIQLSDQLGSLEGYTFYMSKLTSIEIPASVTSISADAFTGCLSMSEVKVDPGSENYLSSDGVLLTKDGKKLLFYPCAREGASYVVPEGVTEVCASAFSSAKELGEISMPDSVITIGQMAFASCGKLEKVKLSSKLTTLGNNVFQGDGSLSSIQLPMSLALLGDYAFSGTGITELTVPGSVSEIKSGTFYGCNNLNSVVLDKGVSKIDNYAFMACPNLATVTVPATVTVIEDMAFENVGTGLPEGQAFTIRGVGDSYAKVFAEEKGIAFEVVDDPDAAEQIISVGSKAYTKKLGAKPFSLKASANTKLSYSSSNPAVATVSEDGKVTIHETGKTVITIVAAGNTQFKAAARKVSVKVELAGAKLNAKNLKGRQVKLSWTKVYGATGYMVYVKAPGDKRFKMRIRRSAKVKSVTHMGLAMGKTYKYKVRAFRVVGGKTVYSAYSKVKTVKVTK